MSNTSKHVTLGAILAAALTTTIPAQAEDLFGRTGLYDATGSAPVKNWRMDYDFIKGLRPTAAELRGLAGAATVEMRRNYVYVQDTDGTQRIPYQSQDDLFNSFEFALREVYRALPDEFVFVYLFTSFDTGVGAFFYAPEASNTRGIGQATFDQNGASPREGFIFMNYWRSFEDTFGRGGEQFVRGQARSVFNQEAGHRWCCFVTAGPGINGTGTDLLLGRDDSHWSYFAQSGGSPMEGNGWRDNGNGTFTTTTNFNNWQFSPLDQYLMGLIPPADVPSFFVIQNPSTGNATDLFGQRINRASTPQIIEPVTASGTRVDISIDSIVSRNGPRIPAAGQAPTSFKVVFVMLAGRTSGLSEPQRVQFEQMVDDYALGFSQGTGGRATLDYELVATPKLPIGGACQMLEECDQLESSVCLVIPPVAPGSGMCTRACSSAASCPDGWCCQPAESGVDVCLPSELCRAPEPPDAGMTTDPDAGVGADASTGGGGTCTCDVTFSCDKDQSGQDTCTCDPECLAEGRRDSCTCVAAEPARSTGAVALALVAITLLARPR
ncbi:hypothetical protein L6R52_40150, partial [Myxococcota bacterium]|nr:hypothetical protein [Myxococcota bacterium]